VADAQRPGQLGDFNFLLKMLIEVLTNRVDALLISDATRWPNGVCRQNLRVWRVCQIEQD
jgi:hypothetical protein